MQPRPQNRPIPPPSRISPISPIRPNKGSASGRSAARPPRRLRPAPLALCTALLSLLLLPAPPAPAETLPYHFETPTAPDRVLLDFPLPPPPSSAPPTALLIDADLSATEGPLPALTVHLHAGDGWLSAETPYPPAFPLRLPLTAFAPEGHPAPAVRATEVRFSLWNRGTGQGRLAIRSAAFAAPASIAVLHSTDATARGEAAFADAMARRLSATLDRANLPHDLLPDADLSESALSPYALLFLPYAPTLTPPQLAKLRSWVSDGGKLVTFYQSAPGLASLLSCTFGPYRETPVTAFQLDVPPADAPLVVPHATTSLLPPHPRPPAQTFAHWLDPSGRPSDLPAVVLAPDGAAFAHVPPLPSPAAAHLMALLAARLVGTPAPALPAAVPASDYPSPGDLPLRAAWCPSLAPPLRATWRQTFEDLSALPLAPNALYVLLPAPVAPSSATPPRELAPLLSDAARAGVAVHAWVPLLTLDPLSPALRQRLAAERRTLPGHPLWLDPANPKNRQAILDALLPLAKTGIAGIHFDYVRTPDDLPSSSATAAAVTDLLRALSEALRKANPSLVLSAAVYPTPQTAAARNQNWPQWLAEGLLDNVSPMIYANDLPAFQASLDACLAAAPADRLLPGVAVAADEAQPAPAAFAAQLRALSAAHTLGPAYFPLSPALPPLLHGF